MHSKNQKRHCSPSSSRAPLVPVKAKMSLSQSEVEPVPFRVPRDYPHSRFSKAPLAVYPPKGGRTKACVSLPVVSLEKMPCFSRSEGAHVKVDSTSSSSTTSSAPSVSSLSTSSSLCSPLRPALTSPAAQKNQEKLLNGRGPVTPCSTTPPLMMDRRPSPSRSPLDKRTTPSPSSSSSSQDRRPTASPSPSSLDRRTSIPPSPPKHLNGAKGSRHRRVSGRVFDPNKHCGVLDPESKRPCTRSLTCKTHSLTHRRAVLGRKKDFDILLAEHKGRAKEKEAGPKKEPSNIQPAQLAQSLEPVSSLPSSCHNGKTTPTLKLRLANAHIQRGCGGAGTVVLSSVPVPLTTPDHTSASWALGGDARVSSDEEAELPDEIEKTSFHFSLYHPRPISWCGFSSRLMGRGHYVFDRRWDRMRLALHCMVEKHVNAQMWRKVPLVADAVVNVSPSLSEVSPLISPPLSMPTAALPLALDGVSMVSYSTPFSHNGAGVFCIRDPDPKLQQTKPVKPARAFGEATAARKRKPPPPAEAATYRKTGNGYHPPPGPANISNGTAALSIRTKSRTGGQGLRDSDRYASVELSLPQALTGDHGMSSHSSLPCGSTEVRKRKTPGSNVRPGKITKTTALEGIFRRSGANLLSSVDETSHGALSRLPTVHH